MVKNPPTNAGVVRDVSLIPESGRSAGKGNGNPFQYSSLGNPMDRGGWQAIVQWIAKSQTRLSTTQHIYVCNPNNGLFEVGVGIFLNLLKEQLPAEYLFTPSLHIGVCLEIHY